MATEAASVPEPPQNPPSGRPVTIRSLIPSAFLPAMVYEIGNGAIIPVIALTALDCGASHTEAAFMLTLTGLGLVLGDVPASALAQRVGDRRAMAIAAAGTTAAMLACLFAHSLLVLASALLVIGMCSAVFYLARQAYLIEVIPNRLRARAMSTLGGSHRLGLLLGPFLGAAAIALLGLRAAYGVGVVAAASAVVLVVVVADVERGANPAIDAARGEGAFSVFRARRRMFLTLGTGLFAVGAVRACRQTVVPLWAVFLGLGAEQTSIIVGLGSVIEVLLFYPAGKVMDHFGRLAVAVPSMLVLSGSMLLLPLTDGATTLTIVAVAMGAGNGIGMGILLTIGADVAPAEGRLQFLSAWRIWADAGNASGPVLVSVISSLATLGTGIVAAGAVGLYSVGALAVFVPRYSPFATPRSVRANRVSPV